MATEQKYQDKLAKYIIYAAVLAIVCTICWYFRSVLIYILLAVVVSLLAKPIVKLLKKIQVKKHSAPAWLLAVISLVIVIGLFLGVLVLIVPVVTGILKDISMVNVGNVAKSLVVPLGEFNEFLRNTFSALGPDFRVETFVIEELQKLIDVSTFSTVIGSAASLISSFGIGLFAVVFISFFFIKDDNLFTNILCALAPDRLEEKIEKAIHDIGYLLSRYFTGVLMQIAGVALLNMLGLWLIARLSFDVSLGIGFICGILNIVPYVGPFMGGAIGTVLGLVLKYTSAVPVGLDVSFWAFTIILIAIFCFTQLIDNMLFQPLIYSTSIKSTPLEIFIVLLLISQIGGAFAMIVAVPTYTIFRVIAFRFFGHLKPIKRLIPDETLISMDADDSNRRS